MRAALAPLTPDVPAVPRRRVQPPRASSGAGLMWIRSCGNCENLIEGALGTESVAFPQICDSGACM